MKNRLFLHTMAILLLFASCQKEISSEVGQPSGGSLQSNLGDCLPKVIGGTYVAGQALADSNYMEVTVDVAQPGAYTIVTDTVNGYSFRGSGSFGAAGVATVRLKGGGTPQAAGTDAFTVVYDNSVCIVEVTVTAGGSTGGTAAFTLQGTGGACTASNVAGTYTQGTALTATHKVSLQVNVTAPGSWTLSTPAVGGFSFSGSGTFTTTGVQTITLNGSGNPSSAGAQTFMVAAGTSSCTFAVTVAGSTTNPPPATADHFILTNNSWWSFTSPLGATDTIKNTIVGTQSISGVNYKIMRQQNTLNVDDSLFFRKSGNNYYQMNWTDGFSSVFFDNGAVDSILVMKEGLTTNATWTSAEYAGTENGVNTKVRYAFKCDDANATVALNGRSYTGVYKITMKAQVSVNNGAYADDVTWTNYYAQGIGWIYSKYSDGTDSYELPLRYYKIF